MVNDDFPKASARDFPPGQSRGDFNIHRPSKSGAIAFHRKPWGPKKWQRN